MMKLTPLSLCCSLLLPAFLRGGPAPEGSSRLIHDGRSLEGWDGRQGLWRVDDGAITGEIKDGTALAHNEWIYWKDEVHDFELTLEYRRAPNLDALQQNGMAVVTVSGVIPAENLHASGPGGPPDPHVWADPERAALIITGVEAALKAALPKRKACFTERAHRLRLEYTDAKQRGRR